MTLPAVCSLPIGVDHKGLPFGIQIAGPNGSDHFVLGVAQALEKYLEGSPELCRPIPDITKLENSI